MKPAVESSKRPFPRKRGGKLDHVSFKVASVTGQTESAIDVAKALERLGGVCDIMRGSTLDVSSECVESVKPVRKDRGPIPMTAELIERVQEPDHASRLVDVQYENLNILREESEWPAPEKRWDGVWHGTEESRLVYLRKHQKLWGLLREDEVIRFTSCFFIHKKDQFHYRKILACVSANQCCRQPGVTKLPGPWNLMKINSAYWKQQLFLVAEGDVDCFFSRLQSPKWLMRFLCLKPVLVDDIIDFSQCDGGVYTCPYSGNVWRSGEYACPAWPRVPMGWSWSVQLATQLSEAVARKANFPPGVSLASLNIPTYAPLRTAENYYGIYIDNIFTFGSDRTVVTELQNALETSFEEAGLCLGDHEEARAGCKVVGINTGPTPKLAPPGLVASEAKWVAVQTVIFFWMFERVLGKFAWCFPLRRRFFSILHFSFEFLTKARRREVHSDWKVRLPRKVRDEFLTVVALMQFLYADLSRENGFYMYASDASLQGWAYCRHRSGGGWVVDSRELQYLPSVQVLHLTGSSRWQCLKRKKFAYRLSHILPGEICSFRQVVSVAARENRGRRIIVFTDSANIYFSVRKGRSGKVKLNCLCRHVLLCELVYDVCIDVRWIPSEHMPADRYTRIWE